MQSTRNIVQSTEDIILQVISDDDEVKSKMTTTTVRTKAVLLGRHCVRGCYWDKGQRLRCWGEAEGFTYAT